MLVDASVLDEATAYADPHSEALIQDALSELAAGRTLLVIAHRLYTIRSADWIVALEGGRVTEQGCRDGLLAVRGRYATQWEAQRSAMPDRTGPPAFPVCCPPLLRARTARRTTFEREVHDDPSVLPCPGT
ncbi:ABC-type multidrug transport system ATPase subunit [Streptomyces phaeochromogenes]|nr:ABC-type multidrug transport system ATPase subunit [Streptomyces phaeochromogenes]